MASSIPSSPNLGLGTPSTFAHLDAQKITPKEALETYKQYRNPDKGELIRFSPRDWLYSTAKSALFPLLLPFLIGISHDSIQSDWKRSYTETERLQSLGKQSISGRDWVLKETTWFQTFRSSRKCSFSSTAHRRAVASKASARTNLMISFAVPVHQRFIRTSSR